MKTVKQADIKRLQARGADVKARSAPAPVPKKPEPTKEERQHASMAASMAQYAAQHEATQQLIARNTEVVRQFAEEVKELARRPAEVVEREEYVHPFAEGATFDIQRDKDKLLKRIHLRPGILED